MIYILQFSKPLGNPKEPKGQAQYYIGYCEDGRLEERLEEHQKGYGAAITRAAVNKGIQFKAILTMDGDRSLERQLKRQKNTPRLVKKLLGERT